MAYRGTTAASSAANPPVKIETGIWGSRTTDSLPSTEITGRQHWMYNTTDNTTDLVSTAYFTDAQALGMQPGDLIMGAVDTGSSISVYFGVIGQVTTDGAGIASSGGFLSSTR